MAEQPRCDPGIQYTAYLEGSLSLSARGEWHHNGQPFKNERLSKLFHRSITRDETLNRYVVRIGVQQATFEYDDCVHFVESLSTDQLPWKITLSTGTVEPLDETSLSTGAEGQFYCRLTSGERARFSRAAHQRLIEHADSENSVRVGDRSVTISSQS